MISEPDFTSRVEKMIAAGVDEREAPVRAILDHGLETGNITEQEKNVALSAFQSFLSSHPGFSFLSPRERYRTSGKNGGREDAEKNGDKESNENSGAENSAAAEEDELWSTIQPILSRDAKNENSVSQRENGVLTRIQKSSGYSPEA